MTTIFIPRFLESAFSHGFTHTDEEGNQFETSVHEMGNLKVTNGKIIACDPFIFHSEIPYAANFPTGEFPVQLAVARVSTDERVAFARINFAPAQTPVSWQLAVMDGQDVSTLKKGQIFGYGVDAGTGCFLDTSAVPAFKVVIEEDDGDAMVQEMEETYKDTWTHLLKELDGGNIALFSSGYGDGFYATYIGTDAAGNICRLITDFGVIFEEA